MTKDEYKQVLLDIALYVLPTYTLNEKQYVPLEYANALRQMAKDALASGKK